MAHRPALIERAYELARSGEVADLRDMERRLVSESYPGVRAQLDGRIIRAQLRRLCAEAQSAGPSSCAAG